MLDTNTIKERMALNFASIEGHKALNEYFRHSEMIDQAANEGCDPGVYFTLDVITTLLRDLAPYACGGKKASPDEDLNRWVKMLRDATEALRDHIIEVKSNLED